MIRENRRVLKAAQLLRSGDLGAIGKLMTASHMSLRDDFEVSWPQADAAAAATLAATWMTVEPSVASFSYQNDSSRA